MGRRDIKGKEFGGSETEETYDECGQKQIIFRYRPFSTILTMMKLTWDLRRQY
jgi:hypothetical protein